MQIDPAILALRGNPAAQRQLQSGVEEARAAWLSDPETQALAADLRAYADGLRLESCPTLNAVFERRRVPGISRLVRDMVAALAASPLAHVPFRHSRKPGFATLQLLSHGPVALSLAVYERGQQEPAPATIAFADSERHELVLAGTAGIRLVRRIARSDNAVELDFEALDIGPGAVLSFEGNRSAKIVDRLPGRLVVLRLSKTPDQPAPAEEYRIDNGELVHRAAARKLDSHREMAMELLGRMGRPDAAPVLARLALTGPAHTRWQALRECLALDTACGFGALSTIAADPHDELAAPAGALRSQLVETYPELESLPCPA